MSSETKLFHFHRIFKNGGGEGVQVNPRTPIWNTTDLHKAPTFYCIISLIINSISAFTFKTPFDHRNKSEQNWVQHCPSSSFSLPLTINIVKNVKGPNFIWEVLCNNAPKVHDVWLFSVFNQIRILLIKFCVRFFFLKIMKNWAFQMFLFSYLFYLPTLYATLIL